LVLTGNFIKNNFSNSAPLETSWIVGNHNISESMRNSKNLYKNIGYRFHPLFKNGSSFDDYDICVVTVARSIVFSEHIKPICLPVPNDEYDYYGEKVIVAGILCKL
jgi:Trypsin